MKFICVISTVLLTAFSGFSQSPFSGILKYKASVMAPDTNAEIRLMTTMGRELMRYQLPANSNSIKAECSGLENGIYLYSLIVNGNIVGTKKLVIAK